MAVGVAGFTARGEQVRKNADEISENKAQIAKCMAHLSRLPRIERKLDWLLTHQGNANPQELESLDSNLSELKEE